MINDTYKVVYGTYEGYADTQEEAKELEAKFKKLTEEDNNVPLSKVVTYDDYIRKQKDNK